jgi:hypothetical protein
MGWMVNATSRPLYPRERSGTHCIGGWVGPRAGLDGCGKSRPPPGFDPRIVQPVVSRYTDCAVMYIFMYLFIYIFVLCAMYYVATLSVMSLDAPLNK